MYEKKYRTLFSKDIGGMSKLTGCLISCSYNEYKQIGRQTPTSLVDKENYIFVLWANSDQTFIETEEYIYPLTSLVIGCIDTWLEYPMTLATNLGLL